MHGILVVVYLSNDTDEMIHHDFHPLSFILLSLHHNLSNFTECEGSDLLCLALCRRSSRASSGNRRRNLFDGEFRFDDAGDWGAESSTRQLTAVVSPFTDLITETGRVQFVHEAEKEKPPGLTQEALDCLQREIFSSFRIGEEEEVSKVSFDCGICLESFTDGDELICLPCDHRFHSACLYPWVRSCGDCPYCRRDIVVNSPIGTRKT